MRIAHKADVNVMDTQDAGSVLWCNITSLDMSFLYLVQSCVDSHVKISCLMPAVRLQC